MTHVEYEATLRYLAEQRIDETWEAWKDCADFISVVEWDPGPAHMMFQWAFDILSRFGKEEWALVGDYEQFEEVAVIECELERFLIDQNRFKYWKEGDYESHLLFEEWYGRYVESMMTLYEFMDKYRKWMPDYVSAALYQHTSQNPELLDYWRTEVQQRGYDHDYR